VPAEPLCWRRSCSPSRCSRPLAHGPHGVELAVIGGGELVGGVAVMLFDVTAAGITLSSVPTELLDRVSSCMAFLTQGVKPLGALAGGVLGTALDLHPALWVAAAGATTTMLWTVFSPLRKHPGLPGGCRPDAHAEGPPT
jgi:hypothetical protein